jgi:dipeptidyl aminopeptidase/acylaminoacyl peptidase
VALAESPDAPPTWYLYDISRGELSPFGESYPELAGAEFGRTRWFTYKARDGVEIPAYLTLPPGAAPGSKPPLVVLPHGGPASRDTYEFDYLTQFLATRGYAVLRPQFRGSTGFGGAFEKAGDHEWAGKMQSDLVDGVAALGAEGLIDPQRACIVGWSFGGYAALISAALFPDAYRCVVSVNGVSDLSMLIGQEKSSFGDDSPALAYWRRVVGDPDVNESVLKESSPAYQAARIKAPVLLIHGQEDTTAPYKHSLTMRKALIAAGKPVEMVAIEGDDHYLFRSQTRTWMLEALEGFLAKHLPAKP